MTESTIMTEAKRIDGKQFAETLVARVSNEATKISAATGTAPGLAVVLVGDDQQVLFMFVTKLPPLQPRACVQSNTGLPPIPANPN